VTLNPTTGGAPGPWSLTGAYRVDSMCTLNNVHCSETVAGSRDVDGSLMPWTGTGRPGLWKLKIPALAAPYHPHCTAGAIDDPNVRNTAIETVTLHGSAKHPRPRTKIASLSLSETLPCGPGCKDSYKLNGKILILGAW
jgi:hypothetical protein